MCLEILKSWNLDTHSTHPNPNSNPNPNPYLILSLTNEQGAIDPRSPVVLATAEALQIIKPDEPHAEAIASAMTSAHDAAIKNADKVFE